MQKYYSRNRISLFLIAGFTVFTALSYLYDLKPGKEIFATRLLPFGREMIYFLPATFILIGLVDVWVNKEKVEMLIGKGSGLRGNLLVILLAMFQAGPLYTAFPTTYLLWKKGASVRNIFLYLGAFSTIKLPLLIFEVTFLGWKFSLIRNLVTFPMIFVVSFIMEKIIRKQNFKVRDA
ncbi:MAG TPA: permease [Puia sp.]|uniref:permease n=1 Tax=Puia sp. TaxID=2045100 RepID=UPI002C1E4C82|nr:permease [Puia sp.]HVU99699.1 permease [Puia sp.]